MNFTETQKSSNIEKVGYNEEKKELHVVFRRNSGEYVYEGVPRELFEKLISAPSAGKFFISNIKSSDFKWHRVEKA